MKEFLAYFDIGLVVNLAVFSATLVFSQKIKDFFKGIPSHTRASLKQIETGIVAKVTAFETDLVATIVPADVKPPAAPAPVPVGTAVLAEVKPVETLAVS